jgi:hypothetical protein
MATDFDKFQLDEMQAASRGMLHVHQADISKEPDVAALFKQVRMCMRLLFALASQYHQLLVFI